MATRIIKRLGAVICHVDRINKGKNAAWRERTEIAKKEYDEILKQHPHALVTINFTFEV